MGRASRSAYALLALLWFALVSCSRVDDSSRESATLNAALSRETASAPAAPTPSDSGVLHYLPRDVQRALNDATSRISDRVDPLMREKDSVVAIVDPAERLARLDALRDSIGALAAELEEQLDDPQSPWAKFRRDPDYAHCFQQYESRFQFYGRELNDLKQRSQAALEASKSRASTR